MNVQTHFIKKDLKNKQFVSSAQSVFYGALPEGVLLTKDSVIRCVESLKESPFRSRKTIESMLDAMVKDDYVAEFYGMKLEKLLNLR